MNNETGVNPLAFKYFIKWKRKVNNKREIVNEHDNKLNNLLKLIQMQKTKQAKLKQDFVNSEKNNQKLNGAICYKNRFKAQKNAIVNLTSKLEERDKLIEELKLGIIREDILKSVNNTKVDIREIFSNCSAKIKCKIPPPSDYNEKFMVSTQKAPKIAQKMEHRALERVQKRAIIQERKRLIEETKKRIVEEAIENKRVQDEDEKKRNLELIKERRRKELELDKIRQINKQIFLNKFNRAVAFYERKLLSLGFAAILDNYNQNKLNYYISEMHYKKKLFQLTVNGWNNFIEEEYYLKNQIADANYAYKITKKCFIAWREFYAESVRSMQVAEDLYDFRLLSNTFIFFYLHVCKEIVLRYKKIKISEQHYNKKVLFHYFYQWRTFPAVLLLEKAKEERKRKWREKVWKILPDYQPPEDF